MRLSSKFFSQSDSPQRTLLPFLVLSFLLGSSTAGWAAGKSSVVDALLSMEAENSLCNSALDAPTSRERLRRFAEEARAALADLPATTEPAAIVRVVNQVVLGPDGIRMSPDLHNPCSLLLGGVLSSRQGHCLGIAGVYLGVAERLGLPIHVVGTPSHVFLRYDDGTTRINIETSDGSMVSDSQYVEQQRIVPMSVKKGVFLQNLTGDRFLAQVHNNLGVLYSERRDTDRARAEYEAALRLDRRLPAAWYNLGKQFQELGRFGEAAGSFTKALRLHPNDTWALNNRAMVYIAMHQQDRARQDLENALRVDPGFEQARRNLAALEKTP